MIKEYDIRQDEYKRPVLIVKNHANIQKVHDISEKYDNPEKIADMLDAFFDVRHLAEEYAWMVCLTAAGNITGVFELSHGTINNTIMNTREMFQKALLVGSVSIIIAHCHPSGDPEPSSFDIRATKKIKDAGEMIGVPLLDHLIIGCGTDDYYSFKENEILDTM